MTIIGSALVSSFRPPTPPSNFVAKNRFIFTHFAEISTLFDCEGRSR